MSEVGFSHDLSPLIHVKLRQSRPQQRIHVSTKGRLALSGIEQRVGLVAAHVSSFLIQIPREGFHRLGTVHRIGRGFGLAELPRMEKVEEIAPLFALHERPRLGAQHFIDVVGTHDGANVLAVVVQGVEFDADQRIQRCAFVEVDLDLDGFLASQSQRDETIGGAQGRILDGRITLRIASQASAINESAG